MNTGTRDDDEDEDEDGETWDDDCDDDCVYELSGNYCPECHRGD